MQFHNSNRPSKLHTSLILITMPGKHVHFAPNSLPPTPSPTFSATSLPSSGGPITPFSASYKGLSLPRLPCKIHPALGVSNTPHILYDVSYPPSTLRLRNPSISLHVLAEPATEPPLPFIHVISPHLPWRLTVSAKHYSYVTVSDLLEGMYHALRLNATQSEYELLPFKEMKLTVNKSYERRYSRLSNLEERERERTRGLRRIDFLGTRSNFLGLSSTQEGAHVWQLNVS